MKRNIATERLTEMLGNLHRDCPFESSISEVWVFGSYAKGSPTPGDIDLEVILDPDETYEKQRAEAIFSKTRRPEGQIYDHLFGRRRCFHMTFGKERFYEDLGHRLLYRRGDTAEMSLHRLTAIKENPELIKEARTVPELSELAGRIPTWELTELSALVSGGWVQAESIAIPPPPAGTAAPGSISRNYAKSSPLVRSALAGILELERRGARRNRMMVMGSRVFELGQGYRHRRRWDENQRIGWGESVFSSTLGFLSEDKGHRYLFLTRPTRKTGPVPAILFRVPEGNRQRLAEYLGSDIEERIEMLPELQSWLDRLPKTRFSRLA